VHLDALGKKCTTGPLVMVWAISLVDLATGFTSTDESSGGLTKT